MQCRLLNTTKILHDPVQVPSSEKNFEPTEEEIDKILDNFRAEYVSRSAEGNIDRLVEMYHPEAVIVHVGQFAKHGHAAIKEVLSKWAKEKPNITFEENKIRRFAAGGGEYLFTDSSSSIKCIHLPGTVSTIDFGVSENTDIYNSFHEQDLYSGGAPHVCSEYWVIWYTRWGDTHDHSWASIKGGINKFKSNLEFMYYNLSASWNIYMIHGGTSFGFWNGADDPLAITTSSDWTAAISEEGDITDTYLAIRDFILNIIENRGRNKNYQVVYDSKGLNVNGTGLNSSARVTLDGTPLQNWVQCGVNLTKEAIDSLSTNFFEKSKNSSPKSGKRNKNQSPKAKAASLPGVYVGKFIANEIQDTFFDSTGWGKGQLFINGYNLGHYWPLAGPQMTLYVPKPFLQQKNTVILIELVGGQQTIANFIDHKIWLYPKQATVGWKHL
uniref:Beta-galactosidase n=1 Tax=Acrobeloides nanus TaxID=290746 RepID=A0A914E8T5_9BILA